MAHPERGGVRIDFYPRYSARAASVSAVSSGGCLAAEPCRCISVQTVRRSLAKFS